MSKAVRFDDYGELDVLDVVDVPDPTPAPGQVLVRVKAAGINPGEASIRRGVFHAMWPSSFPSGQGSDLAGVVEAVGDAVTGWSAGDEVIGWTDERAGQAELVVTEATQLTAKPPEVPWEVAGGLFVAGTTAWACVRAVGPQPGETVVITGAAGGVGSLTIQLAQRTGARVIGLAGAANHDWLRSHGAIPVAYGDGVAERIREQATRRGRRVRRHVRRLPRPGARRARRRPRPRRQIIPPEARDGIHVEGNAQGSSAEVLAELAGLVAAGELEVPIAATYPLDRVRDAYAELERRHTRGKIVLVP
jgi:NADPH:quinone reductase-like Zn-dependent oxidoreductase